MTKPSPDKLKVLWQKGRNYFATFFVELGDVRKQIDNDDEFASWCFTDLHIGLERLIKTSNLLKKDDAAKVKQDLAFVREAERRRKAAAKVAKQKLSSLNTSKAAPFNTKPKPKSKPSLDRNRDRHSPGYMREYMRDYMRRRRAAQTKRGR
jgi:hypothetical protein